MDARGRTVLRTPTRHTDARLHTVLRLVVVIAVVFALSPLVDRAQGAGGSLPVVGTLDRFPTDSVSALGDRIKSQFAGDSQSLYGGTLLDVSQSNQLWQFYPTSAGPTAVAVRDKASRRLIGKFDLPLPAARSAGSTYGGNWIHAFDGSNRAFFLATTTEAGTAAWSVMEVDMRTFATRHTLLGSPMVANGRNTGLVVPAALEYDPHSNALLSLWGGVPASGFFTLAYKFDLATRTGESRNVRSCNGGLPPAELGETYQLGAIIRQDFVYFACQRSGSIGAVVRISRNDILNPDSPEDIVAGPAYLETAFADPASGRIFLVTVAAEIWAFDVEAMSFVGVVAGAAEGDDTPRSSLGLDTATGRLFFLSPKLGLGIAEGRFYPIPQARTFADIKAEARERIISDPKTNTILVLTGFATDRAQTYTVYDVGPAPAPPPQPDPDRNTADIVEQAGVTEARYFASGTGYGVRTLLAKGLHAVPPAPAVGQNAYTADVFVRQLHSQCGFTDRELVAGRVAKAEYDTGTTAAQAVGVDVDERTKLDLEHLSRCDVAVPSGQAVFKGIFSTVPPAIAACDQAATAGGSATAPEADERTCDSGQKWTTQPAYCTSSAGGDSAGVPESKGEAPSRGSTECPQPGGTLKANAVGYLSGPLAVGRAETNTVITRLAKGFVVSTVVAEAQDITMGDPANPAFRIGRVTATATSQSNGRPSNADMSTYRFQVKGISITTPAGSRMLCEEYTEVIRQAQKERTSKNCDIDQAMSALNIAAAGRAEFQLASGLDSELLRGTEKGALTAVQKSGARQASDQALIGDRTTEVPALQVVVYNDNKPFGRARQIYQFAGVATAATYNIARLPSGDGFGDFAGEGGGDAFLATDGGGLGGTADTGTSTIGAPAGSGRSGGSLFGNAVRALLRGIRLFLTSPRHALLLLTAWSLFCLPPVLSRRRRLLAAARAG